MTTLPDALPDLAANGADRPLPESFRLDIVRRRLSLDPRDPGFFQDPYPVYAVLHRAAPVVWWEEFGCLAIADHGMISALLRDRRFGRIMPAGDDGRPDKAAALVSLPCFAAVERHSLLDLEPPTHTRLRALVTRAFVSRQIERLAPRIAALSDELIDGFAGSGRVELVEEFATPLAVTVIAELLGLHPRHHRDMLDWSHRMVAMYQFGRTSQTERDAEDAAGAFARLMRTEIAEKRKHPGDDLVSALIAAEADGGRLDEDEMVSTLILLMNAGHEATVHQLGNAVKAILESGRDGADLLSSEEKAAAATEEALRFDTPLHLFKRVALEDVTLECGDTVRRGEEVALLLGAGNHDPNVFDMPWRFDPDRRGAANVSFGAGIHFCIGAPLARLEIRIALAALFRRLPALRVGGTPRYRDSFHFRGLERLDLAFDPGDQSLTT